MSTTQLLEQLRQLSNAERLEFIEAATRLVRDDLDSDMADRQPERDRRMRAAAARVKDLYGTDSELTEWTVLDGEEFADDYLQR